MALEAIDDGYLAKIIIQEGAKDVPVNTVISQIQLKLFDIIIFN